MPNFPSDESDEWSPPEEFPASDESMTTVATTDPDEDWPWADEDPA